MFSCNLFNGISSENLKISSISIIVPFSVVE